MNNGRKLTTFLDEDTYSRVRTLSFLTQKRIEHIVAEALKEYFEEYNGAIDKARRLQEEWK